MSNIDLSQLITASDRAAEAAADRLHTCKAECRPRIFAVVDSTAQLNLSAAAAAGRLDETQMNIYRVGLGWIAAMRAACQTLAADPDADLRADENWPAVPAGVAELAALF